LLLARKGNHMVSMNVTKRFRDVKNVFVRGANANQLVASENR
jgi:hypothetical protein